MERHEAGEARVIPIILRPTDWNGVPFEKLLALPSDAKPITKWQNRDDAFLDVVTGIRKAIEELTTQISKVSVPSPLATRATERLEHHDEDMGLLQPPSHVLSHLDWGEAHYAEKFFGREKELAQLEQWIVGDHCQVTAVVGIGGIGKTTLVKKLVERIKDEFEYVLWRSLQNAPSIEGILKDCIQFFSNQEQTSILGDIDSQITLLIKYLQEQRCLLVLDNVESILQAGDAGGGYREGYEGYAKLISYLGEVAHQSCLLLTSREKPKEFTRLEGMTSSVLSLTLLGLGQIEGREILKDKGLFGSDEEWTSLIHLYSGNPLALKLIASSIRDLFGGNIAKFLEEREIVFGDINDLLHEQYYRLSKREQEVMYWLAIEREPVALEDLREDIVRPLPKGALLEVLNSLQRRSMVERSMTAHFTLQPVITEYVTDELVKRVYEEIESETIEILASHALMKAQAKDYVRDSQIRLILIPLMEELLATMGKEGSEKKLKSMISTVREDHPHTPSYAAGNILNLLVQLQCDLCGWDFSHLVVWQAYLQGVALPAVNFAHSRFAKCVFTDTFGSIMSVTLSPNGKLLAAGAANGEIRLWQVPSGTPQLVYQGHTDRIRSVVFNPSGDILASCSEDLTVRLWDVSSGQCLKTLQGNSWIRSVAFSPDGNTVVSGSDDQTVRLWEASTGQCLKTLRGHANRVRVVTFSPDSKILVSGSEDQIARLWNVDTGECFKMLRGHSSWICSAAFSPDGQILATGSYDHTIRFWDTNNSECLKILRGHANRVRSVAFSAHGNLLASGGEDQFVQVWKVSNGYCLNTLRGHTGQVWSVAFSPNGQILASGSHDQTIRLWDISSGRCLKTLQGHTDRIWSVAYSPNGRNIASAGDDGMIKLWNTQTGICFKTLRSDRPYENLNIRGVEGLTEAQKVMLKALGAIEDEQEMTFSRDL